MSDSKLLFLSPTPKSATTTKSTEAAKPATTKSTPATEAITAKSATTARTIAAKSTATTKTIKAAALKTLEPLARKVATRAVLSFAVQITGSTTAAVGPSETAFAA